MIKWLSSNKSLINDLGQVIHPSYLNEDVYLTPTVTINNLTRTGGPIQLTVIKELNAETLVQEVEINFASGDSPLGVSKNLSLINNYFGHTVKWLSNDPTYLTA